MFACIFFIYILENIQSIAQISYGDSNYIAVCPAWELTLTSKCFKGNIFLQLQLSGENTGKDVTHLI